ncbi:chemoreceptor glutamine deamidase CheD [Pseudomonadota bacterium]
MINRTGNKPASHALPPILEGFAHINRYWDKSADVSTAKILPGEYYVTEHDEVVVTVLGSCVSACIRDTRLGIGGMNHFMLPVQHDYAAAHSKIDSMATRYGNYAMEALINDILKNGGRRSNLEIKLFGGGMILEHMTDVGKKNIKFVHEFLQTEGLAVIAEDLGDIYPRKVHYYPKTGRVRMKKLRSLHNRTIIDREVNYMDSLESKPIEGEIDLF